MPTYKYVATNIEWETDGEEVELPTTLTGKVWGATEELAKGEVVNELSDITGWLHNGATVSLTFLY